VDNSSDSQEDRIPWHTAFFDAIRMELEEYGGAFEFIAEHQLSSQPLRIDVVIIKKAKGVQVKKNIAEIFRRDNIVEYKSPDDSASVRDFYKVHGYACLYAALEEGADMRDMTLTIVQSRHPRTLISHLRETCRYAVAEKLPGVYIVSGGMLPIQIIDSRRLSAGENLWLKGLSNRLNARELWSLTSEIDRRGSSPRLGAYLDAIVRANKRSLEEAIGMSDGALTVEKIFERAGLIAKWEARAEARGRAIGEAQGETRGEGKGLEKAARNALAEGASVEFVQRITGLDAEAIASLRSQ